MAYEIVHTLGIAIYFLFILLFLWMGRIPRTNPGAHWWATSLTFALISRSSIFYLLLTVERPLAISVYAAFNILEKSFLVAGFTRFFDLKARDRWILLITCFAELWLLLSWLYGAHPLVRSTGYSLVNVGFMIYMSFAIFATDIDCPPWILKAISAVCAALALHWATGPVLAYFYPYWLKNAFVLGTILVALQYLFLLVAILSLFERRLLTAEAKALKLAFIDPLTGLYNKNFMNTLFDQALLLATRPHHIVAVYYIDLDNFKPINDQAGHAVGDQVLKCVAQRVKDTTRSTDICTRLGGDEFVVIATQLVEVNQAEEVAKKLLECLTQPMIIGNAQFTLGASIGISLYPRHGTDLTLLIEQADKAMYRVKHNGKGGYQIYKAQ